MGRTLIMDKNKDAIKGQCRFNTEGKALYVYKCVRKLDMRRNMIESENRVGGYS